MVGLVVMTTIVLLAAGANYVAPHPPTALVLSDKLQPPSGQYPFGTDDLGRDVLSRAIFGARISLTVAVSAILVAMTIGVPLGLVAGYSGGIVDRVISALIDIFWAFPTFLLALAFAAAFGPSLENVIVAIGMAYWSGYGRLTRGEVLSVRERKFIEAAVGLGAGRIRIMFGHILPNCLTPLLVWIFLDVPNIVLVEASLSFLGLGVQPPTPSWGQMVSAGRDYLVDAPWISTFPGVLIAITVVSLSMLGDALRDILDPRLQKAFR